MRSPQWWVLAEGACAGLSEPRIDVAAADRDVEVLVRNSWLWSVGESLASSIRATWLTSRCRRLFVAFTSRRP